MSSFWPKTARIIKDRNTYSFELLDPCAFMYNFKILNDNSFAETVSVKYKDITRLEV